MNLDKRQKTIAVFVVIALMVLAWQIYQLVDSGVKPTFTKPNVQTVLKETANPTQVSEPTPDVHVRHLTAYQQQYLQLVDEYQMMQMQRMIAEDQAAIAQARATTAAALSKVSDLSGGDAALGDITSAQASATAGDYELIYTGEENNQWTATLKHNGNFHDVTAGSVLPDGTKILAVDNNGVTLIQKGVKKLVTFNGVTPITVATTSEPVIATEPTPAVLDAQLSALAKAPKPEAVLPKVVATSKTVTTETTTATTTADPMNVLDIMGANKKNYTIQVIADNKRSTVTDYMTQNKIDDNSELIKTMRYGKPWFIGVYGNFPTYALADQALRGMSKEMKAQGPFIRRVESVQKGVVK